MKLSSTCLAPSICILIISQLTAIKADVEEDSTSPSTGKLLILLLDGFRWDLYSIYKEHLPGFQTLLKTGVEVEYVEPIFPSMSLPSWTTIATGLYAAHHNILSNFMVHQSDGSRSIQPETTFSFTDRSSSQDIWWQSAEPLWITATKAGKKVYNGGYSRCDVPYQNVLPTECYSYKYINGTGAQNILRDHLSNSLLRFKQGYALSMIHYDMIDNSAHEFCSDSVHFLSEIIVFDAILNEFLSNITTQGLQETVNVIILSDHGATNIDLASGTKHLRLEDYVNVDDIYKVIEDGAYMMISAEEGKIESVFDQLSLMPGVNVYRKKDIPDEFHYKEGQHVLDILLLAQPKHLLLGLKNNKKQLKFGMFNKHTDLFCSTHGYYNMSDMRTIFYANGPAFKKGVSHPPIKLVDEYQIFTHVLGLKSPPHNGTWDTVKDMFENQFQK